MIQLIAKKEDRASFTVVMNLPRLLPDHCCLV